MRDWTAQDLRLSVEQSLLGGGARLDTELLGTLVTDEDHLTVLVRYTGPHPVGRQVQSVHFDLTELYEEAAASTLGVARDEVLHGALHFLDLHELGVDDDGIRHWR